MFLAWWPKMSAVTFRTEGEVQGMYLTMDQAVLITRIMQSTLFGFDRSNWMQVVPG